MSSYNLKNYIDTHSNSLQRATKLQTQYRLLWPYQTTKDIYISYKDLWIAIKINNSRQLMNQGSNFGNGFTLFRGLVGVETKLRASVLGWTCLVFEREGDGDGDGKGLRHWENCWRAFLSRESKSSALKSQSSSPKSILLIPASKFLLEILGCGLPSL